MTSYVDRYFVFDHILADIVRNETIGMLFFNQAIEAGDQQRVVRQLYMSGVVPEMTTLAFHLRRI